jgi:hypothetical protein
MASPDSNIAKRSRNIDNLENIIANPERLKYDFLENAAKRFDELESAISASESAESRPQLTEIFKKIKEHNKSNPEFEVSEFGLLMDCYASAILDVVAANNKLLIDAIKKDLNPG